MIFKTVIHSGFIKPTQVLERISRELLVRICEAKEPYELGKLLGVPKSTVATILKHGLPLKKRREKAKQAIASL